MVMATGFTTEMVGAEWDRAGRTLAYHGFAYLFLIRNMYFSEIRYYQELNSIKNTQTVNKN